MSTPLPDDDSGRPAAPSQGPDGTTRRDAPDAPRPDAADAPRPADAAAPRPADDAATRPGDTDAPRPDDADAPRPDDGAAPGPDQRPLLGGGRFGLFSEALLVGLGVSVLSLPVITAVPALAAGVSHVRRHLDGRPDTVAALWEDFRAACRGVWLVSIGMPVLLLVLLFNLQLIGAGDLPGGAGVRVATVFLVAILLVVVLRSAAGWSPGARWGTVVQAAAKRAGDDLTGTFLLVVALGLCAVMVWMLAPLAVIVPGLLSLAVVAIEHRATVRQG